MLLKDLLYVYKNFGFLRNNLFLEKAKYFNSYQAELVHTAEYQGKIL